MTNEKLYENCKILRYFGQVHDEELSNCHTIENQIARTVAWKQKLILVIMYIKKHTNSCRACHEPCSSNPSPPLILRTKLVLCSGSK